MKNVYRYLIISLATWNCSNEQPSISDTNDVNLLGRGKELLNPSFWDNFDAIRGILEGGGTNTDKSIALVSAATCGQRDIIEFLLTQPGIDINCEGIYCRTALMWSAKNGHKDLVQLFLAQPGININYQDKDGRTALMLAAMNKHIDIVLLLLAQPGINTACQDNKGRPTDDYLKNCRKVRKHKVEICTIC